MSDEVTPVIWWTCHADVAARGPWDTGIIEMLLDGRLWPHDMKFRHIEALQRESGVPAVVPEFDSRAIVIVPARHHLSDDDLTALNTQLSMFRGVLLFLVGDEEGDFPWRLIKHPNLRCWMQMPRPGVHDDMLPWTFFFGNGFKEDTAAFLRAGGDGKAPAKVRDWMFAGQVTHERRKQAANGLARAEKRTNGLLERTHGFTQGFARTEYLYELARSKVCPAPSGPHSQDTFRFFEALEAGSIPIADSETPDGRQGYWEMVYGPFFWAEVPILQGGWSGVGGEIETLLKAWEWHTAVAGSWWKRQKREMVKRLQEDLVAVGAIRPSRGRRDLVTVVVTASPIPSHPSTSILMETIDSVQAQLGEVAVIVACDGVREEQAQLRARYHGFLRQLAWEANAPRSSILPVIMQNWLHQALTTLVVLEYHVDTPLVLFMEHDTPFSDEPIDWDAAIEVMNHGALDVLRFHHEAQVHPEHEHLMIDKETRRMLDLPMRRTTQWSQRPHLTRTDYYRRMLQANFPPTSRTMIEDKMHGIAQAYPESHRIAIYHPDGSIRRSMHTDGRGDEPKYKMRFE